jgi:hypothetical protein
MYVFIIDLTISDSPRRKLYNKVSILVQLNTNCILVTYYTYSTTWTYSPEKKEEKVTFKLRTVPV